MRALMAILLLAALTAGCYPVAVSDECKERIDNCLRNCPRSEPGVAVSDDSPSGTTDTRTMCERRCHGLCHD